jgi:hypothetical protein
LDDPCHPFGCHWWSWSGSNRRPPECKSGALPAELQPLNFRARRRKPYSDLRHRPYSINRGQLDAGTKENQFLATSEKLVFSKWRSGSDSPCLPKLTRRFGLERLFLTGLRCTLKRSLLSETPATFSLRKEVIQPQVLLRLPCYDFTPIMNHTLGLCLPCGSA